MAVCGVCLAVVALVCPFLVLAVPTPDEVWISQAMREMQAGFHLLPTLNGEVLAHLNPLNFLLLAQLPATLMAARLAMVVMGVVLVGAVYLYAHALWGMKAGAYSALFTAASFGFIKAYSLLNVAALPCALVIVAYLVFSLAYLREKGSGWYVVSYLILTLSVVTGGMVMLFFFVGAAVLLVLLDLAPQRLIAIRPLFGIGLVIVVLLLYYLVYRIAGGPAAVGGAFWPGRDIGLWASLGGYAWAAFPWLPLIVPAWIASARPEEWQDWRAFLPAKIAFLMGFLLLWLSGRCEGGYALLGVPFAALLIGYWFAKDMRMAEKVEIVRRVAFLLVGLILIVVPIAYLIRNGRTILGMTYWEGGLLGAVLVLVIALLILVKKQAYRSAALVGIVAVLALAWHAPLAWEHRTPPAPYLAFIAQYRPLLVFQDDLVMRGYLAQAGARPVVVGHDFVPLGHEAYLAVATPRLDKLLKAGAGRMQAHPIGVVKRDLTYALVRVAPRVP